MQGFTLIIAFIFAIILMIFAISKLKIHPFLSIMIVSLLLSFITGIPLSKIPETIGSGFSGTFTSIGIVIILGSLIGNILERTGAALKISDMIVKIVGRKNPELAVLIMGWIVSIPVFCDSGFVILNPIRKAIIQRTQSSSVAMTMALSAGLYISHVLIPPTPGPIAAANALGIGNNLFLVIGIGMLMSILPLTAGYIFAKHIGTKVRAGDEANSGQIIKTYDELVENYHGLPNGFLSIAPIFIPIVLMAVASISVMAKWQGNAAVLCIFLGTPFIALSVGTLFGILLLVVQKKLPDFYLITNDTLKTVGPILFVTAAGGVLGKVIATSDMVNFISANAPIFKTVGIFFPFLLAAIIKSSLGSSTVAITTTAGILAPLMDAIGFGTPVLAALCVMAIGAGAMTVSHANDSYFWVVTNFGELKTEDGYKTQTTMTGILGVATMTGVFIFSLLLR